jgi:tetratricopeptide (TPR) repeat protein/serine/threonine protein kinase
MPESAPTPPAADRNLLFGILALQMDFISREHLIAAMNAWVLEKQTSLGDILLRHGALHDDTLALLEAIVRKHLELHGGDPQASLAAVSSVGSLRRDLEQVMDADVQASLAHVTTDRRDADDPWRTVPHAAPSAGPALRFQILRPHAKGGLGEVFVARDEELHREVALKEIRHARADEPHSRSRFLLEAEITGRLEHPGIVPVYGLGTYPDGRPFYAMRFIRGDTLHAAIERFHKADEGRRDPGERALALRGLLRRFVDICNAVSYAHARGVLHRDLKPANAILGDYGETVVVDWGLAKPTGLAASETVSAEGPLVPASAGELAPTQHGSAVGTPAYMSPEQAAGRLEELSPASDVYSLGATLYCLLTGKAPCTGGTIGEVLQKAQRGEFVPPRRVKPTVPAALEAVCLKAMTLRREDRYATARALAADVERWLGDEAVSAWREPLRLRVGRWARRHQGLVGGLAAGLLVALLAGGAGAWWVAQQRAEQRQAVLSALAEVGRLQDAARWAEARAVLEQARQRLGAGGPHDLREQLEKARAGLDLVAQLDAIWLKRATWVEGHFDYAGADRAYEKAFREAGMVEVGGDTAAGASWVAGTGVREAVVAALDDWAFCAWTRDRLAWLLSVSRQADPDPWRDGLRDPAVWNDAAALERKTRGEDLAKQPPQFLAVVGIQLHRLGGDGDRLLRAAWERQPGDFWVNFDLAFALSKKKEFAEAVGYYRTALALRPGTAAVHTNLGLALQAQGKLAEAIAEFHKAIDLDPKFAEAHTNLGLALHKQGKLVEAIAEYHKAIDLDPKLAEAHTNLGNVLQAQGKLAEAIAEYYKAIDRDPKQAMAHANLGHALQVQGKLAEAIAEYYKAIDRDPKQAMAHTNLGALLHKQGKLVDAIAEYHKAIDLDPKQAMAHYNLGHALQAQGKLAEAIAEYYKAIDRDPKQAMAHTNLGALLQEQGKLADAIAEYHKAIDLDSKLAEAHTNLGLALQKQGKLADAIAEYHKAIDLDPKQAMAHYNLGVLLQDQGKLADAIAEFHKAIDLDPRDANAHGALGQALLAQGDFAAAEMATRHCLELLPQKHPLRAFVSQLLRQCEQMAALDRKLPAILSGEVRPADAAEQVSLAGLCVLKKRYAAAARFFDEAFKAQPALSAGERYDPACVAALAAAGQGEDAGKLADRERGRLREQALAWLRADLALWEEQVEKGAAAQRAAVQKTLRHWQQDADLAGVREAAALEKLPEDHRKQWNRLCADVAALLKKCGEEPKK